MLPPPETYEFGHFRLDPDHRVLLADGAPVPLSSRGFEILQLLVQARDRVVGRDELTAHVWHGIHVDENNLAVQMSALRRALNDGTDAAPLIVTVPGRGYRFVGRVRGAEPQAAEQAAEAVAPVKLTRDPARRRRIWLLLLPLTAVFAIGFALLWSGLPTQPTAPRLSIAVLPFRNLSAASDRDYMADAVTEDLTTDLAHIPGSLVIASGSTRAYRGQAVPIPQIGQALNVRYVLEGSLREADGLYHINAQLIDAATDTHLWADRFDVPRERLSDTQSDIVRRIASALNVTLVDLEGARSLQARPNDPDALDLFFRARSLLNRDDSLAGVTAAQHLLQEAIELEPDFVEALAALGWILVSKLNDYDDPDRAADEPVARRVIAHALQIAPKNPAALSALGFLQSFDGRCDTAVVSFEAALTIDPTQLRAHSGLANCAFLLAQYDKAIKWSADALRLDPLGPGTKQRALSLGMAYFMTGHYPEAIAWLQRVQSDERDHSRTAESLGPLEWSSFYLIAALDRHGDVGQAKALQSDYARTWPHRTIWKLKSFHSKANAASPGFAALVAGLSDSGMPRYVNEHADQIIADKAALRPESYFDPTPGSLPGGHLIFVQQLAAMQTEPDPPIIIDVGPGVAVPDGAMWTDTAGGTWQSTTRHIAEAFHSGQYSKDARFVVVGTGPYEWDGYDAALDLIAKGVPHVYWLRGGEEIWEAAGLPSRDRRGI